MKKIMVLSTGGTIACTETETGLSPTLTAEDILTLVPDADKLYHLDAKTIFNLDSSNIQPEEWKIIAEEVYGCLDAYDGIVVLHGTDTMAYTASILSFMIQNCNKPIIITGSQLPINHAETDAKQNVAHALLAASSTLKGVYVVFGGNIMRGVRVAKVRTTSYNAFESINCPTTGYVKDDTVYLNETPESDSLEAPRLDYAIDPNVFLLKLVPGTRPEILDYALELGYTGVVIEGFGLGGIHCVRRNLLEKVERLMDKGIAVLLTTQCRYEPSDLSVYEPGRQAVDLGIIQGYDMTSECAVTKLMWVLAHAHGMEQIRDMMYRNFCGEITPPVRGDVG